jgi:hypothetical protein
MDDFGNHTGCVAYNVMQGCQFPFGFETEWFTGIDPYDCECEELTCEPFPIDDNEI